MVSKLSEDAIQIAFVRWLDIQAIELDMPELNDFIHVPNGGRRDARTGGLLKKMGVKAGFPDIIFFPNRRGFSGLALELKVKGGKARQEQIEWIGILRSHNWHANAYDEIEKLAEVVRWYFHF